MTVTTRCKALGSPMRVAIVALLRDNSPLTIQDIARNLEGSTDNLIPLRRQTQILCDVGLVQRRRIGRAYTYTLIKSLVPMFLIDISKLFGIKIPVY